MTTPRRTTVFSFFFSLAFGRLSAAAAAVARIRTAHYWRPSAKPADFRIRGHVFGGPQHRRALVDRPARVRVVGPGDHFAQLVCGGGENGGKKTFVYPS